MWIRLKYKYSRRYFIWNTPNHLPSFIVRDEISHSYQATSTEQSPSWEANSRSASQETLHLLRKPKAHYRVHKSQPLVPTLTHMNAFRTFPLHFPKIHSNIILLYTSKSSKLSEPFRISGQNFVRISHLTNVLYMPHPSHNIWWSVQLIKFLIYAFFLSFLPLSFS
jgi:hypothetical protein